MVKTVKVFLEDPIPSVQQCNKTIQQIVWGLVEHIHKIEIKKEKRRESIKKKAKKSELDAGQIDDPIVEEESFEFVASRPHLHFFEDDATPAEFVEVLAALPFSFGNPKSSKKRKNNQQLNNSGVDLSNRQEGGPIDSNQLPNSSQWIESNLYRLEGSYVRVLGNGPTTTDSPLFKTSLVRYLDESGSITEVNRSQLRGLSSCDRLIAKDLLDAVNNRDLEIGQPKNVHYKYWNQRYRLFSKFDHGVVLDDESWYSITPEVISHHVAKICGHFAQKHGVRIATVLDCFSGCGGNAIALANLSKAIKVIAIDIDAVKVQGSRINSKVYGIESNMEWIVADAYEVLKMMALPAMTSEGDLQSKKQSPIDMIVLAPPWGGPSYLDVEYFDLHTMIPSGDGFDLVGEALKVSRNIVYILPKNISQIQIQQICSLYGLKCFQEDIYLHRVLKMKIIYFGDLFNFKKRHRGESQLAVQ